MNDEIKHTDDDLAAEYALGVLEGAERAKAKKRVENDVNFARLVSSWEEKLSGLNHEYKEFHAPASVKAAIDDKLFAEPVASDGMLGLLARFRIPILLAVLVFAATPRVMDYFAQQSTPQVIYTSAINALEDYQVTFVAQVTDQGLTVTQSQGVKPSDKDYELWLVKSDGEVVTLGVLSGELNPKGLQIAPDAKFAISIEQIGGSPTGVAQGPVVALGELSRV